MLQSITVALSFTLLASANALSSFDFNKLPSSISCPMVDACGSANIDGCCVPKMGRILFSQQWIDRTGPSEKFTVHGFWPDFCDGKQGPRNGCDRNRNYKNLGQELAKLNQTLVNKLNENWPSFKGDNPAFWSHEWNKHGTCLSTFEPRCYGESYTKEKDAHDFFVKVMDIYGKYDLAQALAKENIKPGRTYPRAKMVEAIKKNTGLDVILTCRGKSLREVRTWFQAEGREKFIPISVRGNNNCPQQINFPKKSAGLSLNPNQFKVQSFDIDIFNIGSGN